MKQCYLSVHQTILTFLFSP